MDVEVEVEGQCQWQRQWKWEWEWGWEPEGGAPQCHETHSRCAHSQSRSFPH